MTVRFNGHMAPQTGSTAMLNGEPFPSAEIQALWNMIEPDITVQWVAVGYFVLRDDTQFGKAPRVTVLAADGHDYDAWVTALREFL